MKTVVLVTGATRGIGRGISLYLAEKGYRICTVGTRSADDENVSKYLSELSALCDDYVYIQGDISRAENRKNIVDTVFEKCSRLDILVNNAGIAPSVRADLLEMSEESFDHVLNVNLKGTFFLTQYAAKRMVETLDNSGINKMIINITSISTDVSSINRGEYCISKSGLSMVTKLFADRLSDYGINVYELRPGIIETDMTSVVKEKYENLIQGGLLPIKRMGKPEDIAKTVYALALGLLAYSTGEVINVDGGYTLRRL